MLELLHYPFMQRAFVAGVLLAGLLAYLGVLVLIRKMAFFSDGIAHASLAGVAIGVVVSVNPLMTALAASILFAIAMFVLEKKTNLSSDVVIGFIFTSGMALGVLLMSIQEGYQPELIGFLFGNILTINRSDLALIIVLTLSIGSILIVNWRRFTLLSFDHEMAYLSGMNPDRYQLLLYIVLAVSVVLGIKILGVILVSALFIIPVSISKLISRSFKKLVFFSFVFSELIMVLGLLISSQFDLPPGAVIVLTGAAIFFVTLLFKR